MPKTAVRSLAFARRLSIAVGTAAVAVMAPPERRRAPESAARLSTRGRDARPLLEARRAGYGPPRGGRKRRGPAPAGPRAGEPGWEKWPSQHTRRVPDW